MSTKIKSQWERSAETTQERVNCSLKYKRPFSRGWKHLSAVGMGGLGVARTRNGRLAPGPRVCVLSRFSRVWLFVTPWTVAHQAPLSMGFSRQEYWSGLPCPPPGDLPNPGIKPRSLAVRADSLPVKPQGKPKNTGVGSLSLLQWIFWPGNWTGVSCIAGGFFTNWAMREAQLWW